MSDKGIYDPAASLRGIVSKNAPTTEEHDEKPGSDHAGKASRQRIFALWLTLPDGQVSPIYGHFRGAQWMNLAATRIEIPFGGDVRVKGSWVQDGKWFVVILGSRLGNVFTQICSGRRIDVHVCVDGRDDKPFVDSVSIEAMPEE